MIMILLHSQNEIVFAGFNDNNEETAGMHMHNNMTSNVDVNITCMCTLLVCSWCSL